MRSKYIDAGSIGTDMAQSGNYLRIAVLLVVLLCLIANQAHAQSVDEVLDQARKAYAEGQYDSSKKLYSLALEMDPSLTKEQEEWIRKRVEAGATADLNKRDAKTMLEGALTEVPEKHDRRLLVRASFLNDLIIRTKRDLKGRGGWVVVRNAIIVGELDVSEAQIAASVRFEHSILLSDLYLYGSSFEKEFNLEVCRVIGKIFGQRMTARSVSLNGSHFMSAVYFSDANLSRELSARRAFFHNTLEMVHFRGRSDCDFCKASFLDDVTINDSQIDGNAVFTEADFRGTGKTFRLEGSKIGCLGHFGGCKFRGTARFVDTRFGMNFFASDIRFLDTKGKADFEGMTVDGSLIIHEGEFEGVTSCKHMTIGRQLRIEECIFNFVEDVVAFSGVKVGGDTDFSRTRFSGGVYLSGIVSGNLYAHDAKFAGPNAQTRFVNCRVDGYVSLQGSEFLGPFSFSSSEIHGLLLMKKSRFQSGFTVGGLKVGDSLQVSECVFSSEALFTQLEIGGDFLASQVAFKNKDDLARFVSVKVGKTAQFSEGVFRGPVAFLSFKAGGNVVAREAHFESTKTKKADGPKEEETASAVFYGLTAGGYADFSKTIFAGTANFQYMNVGSLYFIDTQFEQEKSILLDGMSYKYLYTLDNSHEGCDKALAILKHMKRHSPQPYKQLETSYSNVGYKDGADAVFLASKRGEKDEAKFTVRNCLSYFLKYVFLDYVVGYGRRIDRVLWLSLICIGVGTLVFSQPGVFNDPNQLPRWKAFWYSLGAFLPMVSLGGPKLYEINKKAAIPLYRDGWKCRLSPRLQEWLKLSPETYSYLHQLAGFILVSTAIAAFAGIIK